VDPDLVWTKNTSAASDELFEDFFLFGRLLFGRQFDKTIHDGSCLR
jgi:hypothetical protein